jgi:acyl carrier protein
MAQTPINKITGVLLNVLQKHLKFANSAETFPMDAELESLGLDSMSAIDLLLALEETFEIVFPDAMLTPEVFRTAQSLEGAVQSLIKGEGAVL